MFVRWQDTSTTSKVSCETSNPPDVPASPKPSGSGTRSPSFFRRSWSSKTPSGMSFVWETTGQDPTPLMLTLTELMRGLASWCLRVPPNEFGRPAWDLAFHVERRTHGGKAFVLMVLTWSPVQPGSEGD